MTEQEKNTGVEIVSVGLAKIIRNYSENALLINACHVAADRYGTLETTNGLSTTANIPPQLRLDNEIDFQYSNEDLTRVYMTTVQEVVFRNYIIVSVSIVDAVLEDLYRHFLTVFNSTLSDTELDKKIRNAWTNDNLLNFLTDGDNLNLQKPNDLNTEFPEAFMRYSELRIIRHTLLHSDGKLSERNLQKLIENRDNTPDEHKHFALIDSPIFSADHEVQLTINHVLSIRQYLDRFLMYIFKSIQEKEPE